MAKVTELPYDWFLQKQKERMALPKNMAKGNNWLSHTTESLFERIQDETAELEIALIRNDPKQIIAECTDIANFCEMIAHILKEESEPTP